MARLYIPEGTRFGILTVIREAPIRKKPSGEVSRVMFCKCDCGIESIVLLSNLRAGHTTSCGCVQRAAGKRNKTHGLAGTPTYRAWQDMIQRCYNPNRKRYPLYGGRGITVCDEWRASFDAFLRDMGETPSPLHSIDRIDNDNGYNADNCRWATRKEQARNTRRNIFLTHGGESLCISEWASRIGIPYSALYYRFRSGWPIEKMLTPSTRRTNA